MANLLRSIIELRILSNFWISKDGFDWQMQVCWFSSLWFGARWATRFPKGKAQCRLVDFGGGASRSNSIYFLLSKPCSLGLLNLATVSYSLAPSQEKDIPHYPLACAGEAEGQPL